MRTALFQRHHRNHSRTTIILVTVTITLTLLLLTQSPFKQSTRHNPLLLRRHETSTPNSHIVGGVPYTSSKYAAETPNFFARLAVSIFPIYSNAAICSATIIGRQTLVTAAHCVKFRNVVDWLPLPFLFIPLPFLSVHIGATSTSDNAFTLPIRSVRVPTSYSAGNREGDIAVITLWRPIPDAWYEPVRFSAPPEDYFTGITFGMGLNGSHVTAKDHRDLRVAQVAVHPPANCRYHTLCSLTMSGDSGALCTHDSGSGLFETVEKGENDYIDLVLVAVSRSVSPLRCTEGIRKTHYYTSLKGYVGDLETFVGGGVPDGWVWYTDGAKLVFD